MERVDGPTPNGGDYAEMYLFDKKGRIVDDEKKAVRGVIRECKKNGELLMETWFEV